MISFQIQTPVLTILEHILVPLVAQNWPPGVVNNEDQVSTNVTLAGFYKAYTPDAATQDGNTAEITIKAEKHSDGSITSARLESYQVCNFIVQAIP